ncbi:tRNA pseudouridine(55) synthase TruB [Actinomyces vulturis]|uniref:tRNA pseudouridine(55) synthase TruB n=1 Tax=Actinomyces vulturis TaxID=1857645 RepID=UPI000829D349|nr:tRNA pseudouridine(55) synthase TruB [Actinomyces vulturis]
MKDRGEGRRRGIDAPRSQVTAADGILLIDKDQGVTSHDVVAAIRRLAATRKVGHAGTLDPMATGLLTIGIGSATRLLTYLVGADKTYEATIRLGQTTSTEDADGDITSHDGVRLDSGFLLALESAMADLTGPQAQIPSAVSAIKVDGVRAYDRVRHGEDVQLEARDITVYAFDRLDHPLADIAEDGTAVVDCQVRVRCSSGTYIRALARDLGKAMGCGAHLTALRRTHVGAMDVGEAHSIASLNDDVRSQEGEDCPKPITTIPMGQVAQAVCQCVMLSDSDVRALRYGQFLDRSILDNAVSPPTASHLTDAWAGLDSHGNLVAMLVRRGRHVRPVCVFPTS